MQGNGPVVAILGSGHAGLWSCRVAVMQGSSCTGLQSYREVQPSLNLTCCHN